jgi:serine/threonine protein kinase
VLSPGDRFEDYVVDAMVGRGGSATVYRAHQARTPGRALALKILLAGRDGPAEQERLQRESDIARRLRHPHVVEVFDSGPGWLATEFAGGGPVTNLATVPNRIAALTQIADALDFIHAQGVVHCDVKPTNILVAEDFYQDGAVLVDFGNARPSGEQAVPHTTYVTASLPYSPPELLTGAAVTGATDVYALACTAVEMITGSPPFTATTQAALVDSQLHRTPPRPSHDIDWLPRAFDSVLAKAMAKNPGDRYQSCAELAALFTRIVRT